MTLTGVIPSQASLCIMVKTESCGVDWIIMPCTSQI